MSFCYLSSRNLLWNFSFQFLLMLFKAFVTSIYSIYELIHFLSYTTHLFALWINLVFLFSGRNFHCEERSCIAIRTSSTKWWQSLHKARLLVSDLKPQLVHVFSESSIFDFIKILRGSSKICYLLGTQNKWYQTIRD